MVDFVFNGTLGEVEVGRQRWGRIDLYLTLHITGRKIANLISTYQCQTLNS